MKQRKLWNLALLVILIYLFRDAYPSAGLGYILSKRLLRIGAMCVCAYTTASASVYFQTLSHNSLITPAILGIDSLYLLVQTLFVFVIGTHIPISLQFLLVLIMMVGVSTVFYAWLLKRMNHDTLRLILVGILGSTVVQSIVESFKMMASPNDYAIIQSYSLATFRDITLTKLVVSGLILIPCIMLKRYLDKQVDCVGLGDAWAQNYGVDVRKFKKLSLIVVCSLSGLTTAIMGPNLFLGLVLVTLSKRLQAHYCIPDLIKNGTAIGIALICGSQLLFETLFHLQGSIAMVLTVVGGLMYGILLLRKEQL